MNRIPQPSRKCRASSWAVPLLVSATVAHAEIAFDRQVRPLLSDKCFHCHGFDQNERKADLRLDTFEGATAISGSIRAVVPGNPGASELIRRIRSADPDEVMPPPESKLELAAGEADLLEQWIAEGEGYEPHWAFRPVEGPEVPAGTHPVDWFVLEKLRHAGLQPNPPASPPALVRRLSLDLTGLPPDPGLVEGFVRDPSPEAWVALVDRFLESPHFGERLAWEWLDAARYADSNGYQGDPDRSMWPWRDWLVTVLNANKPFDQLTVEMLAGDLLPGPTGDQVLASGFNRNHPINGEGGRIADETRVENVFDRAETTATVWMGLTFTCARCHDHKYDPVSQNEYFQLYAFFNQTSESGNPGQRSGHQPPVYDFAPPELQHRIDDDAADRGRRLDALAEIERQIRGSAEPTADLVADLDVEPGVRDEQWERLTAAFAERFPGYAAAVTAFREADTALRKAEEQRVAVMVMDSLPPEKRRRTFVLSVGNYAAPTETEASPGTPSILPPLVPRVPGAEPDRLDLARWLVAPEHPLTARVAANRLWQMVFGTGLVKTAEDFGSQGERPSHPELLDWLAASYIESGWDTKALLRTIATSGIYRQSPEVLPEHLEIDPGNRLLARSPRHRLSAWMLRDQALALSGLLVPSLGGPPVKPYQPDGVWADASFGKIKYQPDSGDAVHRRTIYTFWRRIAGPTMLFDSAKRMECEVKPTRTNTPLHALTTLNDTTQIEAARLLAAHAIAGGGDDPGSAVRLAFRRATSRAPTEAEAGLLKRRAAALASHYSSHPDEATSLLRTGEAPNPVGLDPAQHAALTVVCNLILNLDEVLCRP